MDLPVVEIQDLLQKWARNEPMIDDFTVTNVIATLGLPIQAAMEVYDYLVSQARWIAYPELVVLCENGHKGPAFPIGSTHIDDRLDEECPICGKPYLPVEQWLIVFRFKDSYRAHVKNGSAPSRL